MDQAMMVVVVVVMMMSDHTDMDVQKSSHVHLLWQNVK
jgi:hypothetical protein